MVFPGHKSIKGSELIQVTASVILDEPDKTACSGKCMSDTPMNVCGVVNPVV